MKHIFLTIVLAILFCQNTHSQNIVVFIDSSLVKPINDLAIVTKTGDFRFSNPAGQVVLSPQDFPVRVIENQYSNQVIKKFADTLYLFSKVQILNEVVAAPRDLFEYYEELQEVHRQMITASLPDSLYAEITRFYHVEYDYEQDRQMIYQDQLHVLGVKSKPEKYDWYYQVVRNSFVNKNKRVVDEFDSTKLFSYISILPGLKELFEYSLNIHIEKALGVIKFKPKNFAPRMEFEPQKKMEFFGKDFLHSGDSVYNVHSIYLKDTIPYQYNLMAQPYNLSSQKSIFDGKYMNRFEAKFRHESGEKNLSQTSYEHGLYSFDVDDGSPDGEIRIKQIILWNTTPPATSDWKPWKKHQFDFNAPEGILEYIFHNALEKRLEGMEME
jgi:hypothetical protein